MTLGEVMKLLQVNGYPIDSIQFTCDRMRGDYCPSNFYGDEILSCTNLRNGSSFNWRWGKPGNIDSRFKIEKVTVDGRRGSGRSSRCRKIVTLHLEEIPLQ